MKKYLEVALHIIAWLILISFLVTQIAQHDSFLYRFKGVGSFIKTNTNLWLWHSVVILFKVVYVYINIYWVFPLLLRSTNAKVVVKPLMINMLACMIFEVLLVFGVYYLLINGHDFGNYDQDLQNKIERGHVAYYLEVDYNFIYAQLSPYILFTAFSYIYWATKQWLLQGNRLVLLNKTTAELALIKAQINPHFLFSTLNSLFSMAIEKEAPEVATGIAQFTKMMKHSLYENNTHFIPLTKEVEYLENYIALQELRFPKDVVAINFTISGELNFVQIAPLLLINFVENAFKHGISLKKKSFILMHLEVSEDKIKFELKNTIHRQVSPISVSSSGLGLKNAKRLLELQYPDRHHLSIEEIDQIFILQLTIYLQQGFDLD